MGWMYGCPGVQLQELSATLTFYCRPDYFVDPETNHIIAVNMDSKGNIRDVELVEI